MQLGVDGRYGNVLEEWEIKQFLLVQRKILWLSGRPCYCLHSAPSVYTTAPMGEAHPKALGSFTPENILCNIFIVVTTQSW